MRVAQPKSKAHFGLRTLRSKKSEDEGVQGAPIPLSALRLHVYIKMKKI